MGQAPMLSGSPSKQAGKSAVKGNAMPKRSPGKPGNSLKGSPGSVPNNKATKQPKRKGGQTLKKGTVKGINRGKVSAPDMGIG